jgi:type III restriction enzyme
MAHTAPQLYELLADDVAKWRQAGYPDPKYPAISEILKYQTNAESGDLRFLRRPQFHALETYWYMRRVAGTPRVADYYRQLFASGRFGSKKMDFVAALGVPAQAFTYDADGNIEELLRLIEADNSFIAKYKLEALRETMTLAYPSYIMALAMGVGKTILMGAIIATEFAMALEYPKNKYPDSDNDFVENVLVFAPDTAVLRSLREFSEMPYEQILPDYLHDQFSPNLRLTYTRDGERDVPVIRGSSFNVVVTNIQKIRIEQKSILKAQLGALGGAAVEKAKEEVANRRLRTIATLPWLAAFSDEAHHTYGQDLDKLKQVRKTVDYLDQKGRELSQDGHGLVVVVNTTGTPYYKKQPLKDVIISYGLAEGIRDGILKEVRDGIRSYEVSDGIPDVFIRDAVSDFFQHYADYRLPSGARAKLAIYFPQNDDLTRLRPIVEQTLVELNQPSGTVFRYTSLSPKGGDEEKAFEQFTYDPNSPYRVVLLVNKGMEGWNCPSLFACALARDIKGSNNFVLQASTRCLRQVAGNSQPARIYLSNANRRALDSQLRETYGEDTTIARLDRVREEEPKVELRLLKRKVEPLYVVIPITKVTRKDGVQQAMMGFAFKPVQVHEPTATVASYSLDKDAVGLAQEGGLTAIANMNQVYDLYIAATLLADRYRAPIAEIRRALAALYPNRIVPRNHLPALARQLEDLCCNYEQSTEYVPATLAIVRLSGWKYDSDDDEYTLTAKRPKEELLVTGEGKLDDLKRIAADPRAFGYHYAPYVFRSMTEAEFYAELMLHLKSSPDEVEDVYFTGGLTDDSKTDFYVEYTQSDGSNHHYFPDFLIRKRLRDGQPGPCLIVEVKSSAQRAVIEKEIEAVREGGEAISSAWTDEARKSIYTLEWVDNSKHGDGNPLSYTMVFDNDVPRVTEKVKQFINQPPTGEQQ